MNELLFLSADDTIPTWCATTFDNATGLYTISYSSGDGISFKKRTLHPNEYNAIKNLSMDKFLDTKFMDSVKSDHTFKKIAYKINNELANKKQACAENNNMRLSEISNIGTKPVKASSEYVDDMKNLYTKVMEAESIDLVPISNDILNSVIGFMSTLTNGDRDSFYADLRSRIDSEFYGKVVISKEEFENFKKYEKIIKDIKAV